MRKTLSTIGLSTLLVVGVVYGGGLLSGPSSNQTDYFNYSYVNTTNSTTTLKSASGVLHSLTFDTFATSSVVTLFDGTVASNTVIAKVTVPDPLASNGPQTAIFDVAFKNGLTVQQTGATSTFTISYF